MCSYHILRNYEKRVSFSETFLEFFVAKIYFRPIKYKNAKTLIKINIYGAVILKNKDSDKPNEKSSWYKYSSSDVNA